MIKLDVNEAVMHFFFLFGMSLPTVFIIQCSLTVAFHFSLSVIDSFIKLMHPLKIIRKIYFNYHEIAVPRLTFFTDL